MKYRIVKMGEDYKIQRFVSILDYWEDMILGEDSFRGPTIWVNSQEEIERIFKIIIEIAKKSKERDKQEVVKEVEV